MKSRPVAHYPGSKNIAFNSLDSAEDPQYEQNFNYASSISEIGKRKSESQSDHAAQVGNNVEQAKDHSYNYSIGKSHQYKSNGEQNTLGKGYNYLPPEECQKDVNELIEEVDHIVPVFLVHKRQELPDPFCLKGFGH